MKRITLRLPDDLHEQLQAAAKDKNRSLNAQIITYLRAQVKLENSQRSIALSVVEKRITEETK